MKYPTHVVVDTSDGAMFWNDHQGELFTQVTATAFARGANTASRLGHKTYALFRLESQNVDSGYTLSDDGKVVYPL